MNKEDFHVESRDRLFSFSKAGNDVSMTALHTPTTQESSSDTTSLRFFGPFRNFEWIVGTGKVFRMKPDVPSNTVDIGI